MTGEARTSSGGPRPADARDSEVAAVMRHAVVRGREQSPTDDVGATRESFGDVVEESLRAARRRFVERLHARSDDFEATYGLRALEAALRA